MKKEKFTDDNLGRAISKDLIKDGKKYGFEVVTDQYLYTELSYKGDVTELHDSAYPSIDDSIEISITYRSVYRGGYTETFEAESSMGNFSSDSAEGLFKKLQKALDSGIKKTYTARELNRLMSFFDRVRIEEDYAAGRITSHKELNEYLQSDWARDNLKRFTKDFEVAVEEKGWYYLEPKSHVRIIV